MSQAASYVDPAMLEVKNLGYDSWKTVYFQRATVLVTELVLLYALYLSVILSLNSVGCLADTYQLRENISTWSTQVFSCGSFVNIPVTGTIDH
jgi:hypothetical protein